MAAYKITFAFACFHFLLGLLFIGVKDAHSARGQVHNGWWGPKLIIWLGMIIGYLFLPSNFLTVYPYISLVGSIVFVVIQLFLLIDFAHAWNDSWVNRFHETQNKNWFRLLLFVTVLLLCLALAGTILMYVFFLSNENQAINIAFITINAIFVIVSCIMSVNPKIQEHNPRASLMTAAIVSAYATYLVASAIMSERTADNCSITSGDAKHEAMKYVILIIGSLITFVSVAFSSLRAGTHEGTASSGTPLETDRLINKDDSSSDEEKKGGGGDDHEDDVEKQRRKADKELAKKDRELLNLDQLPHNENAPEPVAYNYTWFHVVMMLGAMYIGSLMSNWAVIDSLDTTVSSLKVDCSVVSVWLKVASCWLVHLLYLWTLVAPWCLPNRDFGFDR